MSLPNIGDARSFKGTLKPGPGKIVVRIYDGSQEYETAGPDGKPLKLWLPAPNRQEGFFGVVEAEAIPYFDVESGAEYKALYPKGSIVLLGKFTGAPVTVNNDHFIVCRETDVVAQLIPDSSQPSPLVSASASIKTRFDS